MAKDKQPDITISNLKDCFIITPIGAAGSETFKKTDGLIKTVLAPVLEGFGFKALPAYQISASGSITKQVIDHVINDELVIANLTGLNPNVMYELALRHAFKKKVITIAERGTQIPFDISDQRTIFYDDNLHGATLLKPELQEFIEFNLANDVTSNPVIDSIKETAVIDSVKEADDESTAKYILDRFDRMERMIVDKVVNGNMNTSYQRHEYKAISFRFSSKGGHVPNLNSFRTEVKKEINKLGVTIDNLEVGIDTCYFIVYNLNIDPQKVIDAIMDRFGFRTGIWDEL